MPDIERRLNYQPPRKPTPQELVESGAHLFEWHPIGQGYVCEVASDWDTTENSADRNWCGRDADWKLDLIINLDHGAYICHTCYTEMKRIGGVRPLKAKLSRIKRNIPT